MISAIVDFAPIRKMIFAGVPYCNPSHSVLFVDGHFPIPSASKVARGSSSIKRHFDEGFLRRGAEKLFSS